MILATSDLKKLLGATLAPATTKFSAFSLVPKYFPIPSPPILLFDKFNPGLIIVNPGIVLFGWNVLVE